MESKMKTSDAQRRANAKYQLNKTKQYSFKLVLATDSDIIAWLDSMPNKQGYLKGLIRADMAKKGEQQ